jgi:hypothetical protein
VNGNISPGILKDTFTVSCAVQNAFKSMYSVRSAGNSGIIQKEFLLIARSKPSRLPHSVGHRASLVSTLVSQDPTQFYLNQQMEDHLACCSYFARFK